MSEGSASPKRPRLDFDDSPKEDSHDKFKNKEDDQGSYSNPRKRRADTDDDDIKECDDLKSKSMGADAARREHTLVMRLTNKEQELQECMNQMQEMKQLHTQNTHQLRSMLLDPAINLVFQRMSKEMEEHKEKLKQKQNELNAWKFTPDSHTGMRLMGKCRMLLQENGELGKMISSGRTARLEGEISLHKALVAEMKKNQKELDEFVGELEEDVEGMQGLILMLQQQLKEAREQITRLQHENEQLRTLQSPSESDKANILRNGIHPTDNNGSSSTSHFIDFSHTSTDHTCTKSSLANSTDSSTFDFSRESSKKSFAVKETPDSGIHTQEDDDEEVTNYGSVGSSVKSNSDHDSCGVNLCSPSKESSLRTNSHTDDSQSEMTDGYSTKSNILHRTSLSTSHVKNVNGDTQLTDSENVGSEKRTSDDDLKTSSKDKIKEEDELTNTSNDKIEDLTDCLGLNDECPTVNSF